MSKIKSLITFLCILTATSTAFAKKNNFQPIDIPFQEFTLDSGLTVIISEDHKAPVVAVNITYRVGSRNEPKGKRGFAHLFEHVLFQGSENADYDYFKALDKLGATNANGTTNKDRTNYYQTVPVDAFDSILWLESDRMGHMAKAITQEKLDEQRKVVFNEMSQRAAQPYFGTFMRLSPSIYPNGHPYSWSVIGNKDDLSAATLEDAKAWFKDYYGPNNAILTIVGDIKTNEALGKVKAYFGDIPASKLPQQYQNWTAQQSESRRTIVYEEVPLPRIYKLWTVPGYSQKLLKTQAGMDFVASILSQGKNGLLYKSLVLDQHIASDVGASLWSNKLGSIFYIQATAKQGVSLKKLERALDNQLAQLKRKGAKPNHIQLVKNKSYNRHLDAFENVGGNGKAEQLAYYALQMFDPAKYKEYFSNYWNINRKDIKHLAQKWLTDATYTLEIHPIPTYKTQKKVIDRKQLPPLSSQAQTSFPKIQTKTLSNGISLHHIQRSSVPKTLLEFIFEGGSSADPKDKQGLMYLTGDLINEATKKSNALEIESRLASIGASISTTLDQNTHGFGVSALNQNLEPALSILNEFIEDATFPKSEFDRIKKQNLENIQKQNTNPSYLAYKTFHKKVFSDHALGNLYMGTSSTLQAIQHQDVLDMHAKYHQSITPVVFSIGSLSIDDMGRLIEKKLKTWKTLPSKPIQKINDIQPTLVSKIYLLHKSNAPQTHISAGYVFPRDKVRENLKTGRVFDVLGNNFTSRINMNIREDKGWSYGMRSSWAVLKQTNYFNVGGSVQTENTAEAITEIHKELKSILSSKPITEKEHQNYIHKILLQLPSGLQQNKAIMGRAVRTFKKGYPFAFLENYPKTLQSISLEDAQGKAREVVRPDKMIWVLVGDLEKIEAPVRALNLAPVEIIIDPKL